MTERFPTSFRGSSAAEAEDFVQAVRSKAWSEQKQFDYRWMAAYAAAQMSGPALRWHMGLPRDVQGDWSKLEVALLDRFAPDQPPAAPSNNPTVPSGASAVPTPCIGRIRVARSDTGQFIGYLPKGFYRQSGHYINLTTNVDDALVVQFIPSSLPVTFDLVDKSEFHHLALRKTSALKLEADESRGFELICFAPGPKPGSIRYSSNMNQGVPTHVQHTVWKVGADGSITPIWPPSPQVPVTGVLLIPSRDVRSTSSSPCLSIGVGLSQLNLKDSRAARLEFEHA